MEKSIATVSAQTGAARKLLFLFANPVDCDAYALWCQHHVECDVLEAYVDLEQVMARCRTLRPSLLTVDPAAAPDALDRSIEALRGRHAAHLLVFDARPMEARLASILKESGASYFSRKAGSRPLSRAFREILEHGNRVFDPAFEPRLRRTPRGFQFDESENPRSIALLSKREREVMRLLAQGRSVRQCAAALGLSESTIDNHKSRLMKKLGVHKSAELTFRAIREGLLPM